MIDVVFALAEDLATYVQDSECETEVFTTYGEPPAPVGTCSRIFVWLDRVLDRDEIREGCVVNTRLVVAYRIYTCYPTRDDGEDLTADQHLTAAECLYELTELVWCGLVAGKASGNLAGLARCDEINLQPLIVDPPQGGIVSASGSITVEWDCPIS